MEDNILFDDWKVRREGVFDRRKEEYTISFICVGVLWLFSVVGMIFHWSLAILLVLPSITHLFVWLEWLKIKNNHLVIRSDQIEVTNRFNKTAIYKVQINELTIELRPSFNVRSGGIILLFRDKDMRTIIKYEDMLNHAAMYGFEKTDWEKGLEKLGVKIIDRTEINKNKPYQPF